MGSLVKNIIISLVCSFLLMHTVIAHEHYSKYNSSHSIEHQNATTFISHLALGFHHGSEKDLSESTSTSDLNINVDSNQNSFLQNYLNSEISEFKVFVDLFDADSNQRLYNRKHYKSNSLRAPPQLFLF